MAATVYVALETYTGPGAGIYPTAVRTSLRLWLVEGERIMATTIDQFVPYDVARLPDILDGMLEEAAGKGTADGPRMLETLVNHAPSMILSRPPIRTTYRPLPQETFDGLNSYLTGR
ncbi:hypothetical protein HYU15_02920 [Candidatus Woesearchaeota archaeon]|nr:hypothetical protein [Candidatus Woesearchaeota archaeon]